MVLSIFGFFGYKSIKSIEEKANKDAERAAKLTSEDVTKSYLDEKLDGKVSIAAEKIFNSVGADTMKAKVVEETIKHDDEYINSLIANLEKDFKVNHVVVPHGEKSKRFDMLPTLYKACLDGL